MNKGKYIVIEGLTNFREEILQRLAYQLAAARLPVKAIRDPESQNDLTARAIHRLTHDPRYPMTSRTEVLLYNAARSQSLEVIKKALNNGIICLADRSYLTTLTLHYYGIGTVTDYQTIQQIIDFTIDGVEPDLTIVLDTPVASLDAAVRRKFATDYTTTSGQDDILLERIRAGYLWEAKQRNLPVVYAIDDVDTVFKQVWQQVTAALAVRDKYRPATEPQSVAQVLAGRPSVQATSIEPPFIADRILSKAKSETQASASNDLLVVKQANGSYHITDAGKAWLQDAVSNVDGNVYATLSKLESVTAAAAMARLSRRGDDLRVTVLDEFAEHIGKDQQLLKRVITAFGDDSVQQLVSQHIVVENASQLLTKKIERGRLAAYLEQSTRYIYFDQKDEQGRYRYYVPAELTGKIRQQYIQIMDQLFDLYSHMAKILTKYIRENSSTPKNEQDPAWRSATKAQACDAIRPVLPVATKATVGIFASGQALESLVMRLKADDLPEARTAGQQILEEARKVISVFLERADKPERGGALIAYKANTKAGLQRLADRLLPTNHTAVSQPVVLLDYTPRNELDIVADMLYEHSDLPLESLQQTVAGWSYQQRVDVFNAYVGERLNRRHRPGRALEKVHYSWDLVCDYGIFRDLQRHRIVDDLEWQTLSPRLGYDIPKVVEQASLGEEFDRCFDLSLKLYSTLQAAGYGLQAQYATLLGHKMRWKLTLNAREAFQMFELRSSPQGHPGYRRLIQQMYDKLAEVHPLIAGAMRFMNQDEDPELTRLAAERYTQYKLDVLDGKQATHPSKNHSSKT